MEPYTRQHKIHPDEFPESWASGWGEDEFGLWMAFTYRSVSQKFRWCEPGTFLMGSPKKEAGRRGNETQHEVTLSKGFWIGDTTVTQALWQLVMGDNPSRFKGENRPVERVSWENAQEFIGNMNSTQINSELVNFDGAEPYNNGRKSESLEKTVDVESYYQNDWGLWQMHGNVFEWCQDWYDGYLEIFETDPAGPQTGGDRVLRGGSFVSSVVDCRSAYRGKLYPFSSIDYLGFRLIRGC